jgi:hypothetical protein
VIRDAHTELAWVLNGVKPDTPILEAFVAMVWPERRLGPYRAPSGLRDPGTIAYVNHGRWVADCPFCDGGELVTPEDPRFFCLSCGHLGTTAEGGWLAVGFPSTEAQAAIDQELALRPEPNRNWLPWEPVEKLVAENAGQKRWAAVLANRAGEASQDDEDRMYAETAEIRERYEILQEEEAAKRKVIEEGRAIARAQHGRQE